MARQTNGIYTKSGKRISDAKFFQSIFDRFGEKVEQAGKAELLNGAQQIAETAKSLCPVDTGRLRDSIHIETTNNGRNIKVVADAENNGVKYGRIVEFNPKIQKSFLLPARDSHVSEIKNNVYGAIRQAIHNAIDSISS